MFQSSFTSCAFFVFFVVVVEEFCDVFNERISCGFPAHQKKKMFLVPRTCCVLLQKKRVVWLCDLLFFIIGFSPPAPEDQFVRPEGLESDDPLITNESPERK